MAIDLSQLLLWSYGEPTFENYENVSAQPRWNFKSSLKT